MRHLPLLFLVTACWAPKDTGPRSMIGRLLDANGQPLAGVKVESVESESVTDADGNFAINYKEPQQYLFFTHEDVWYKLTYQPGVDDGHPVELRLPKTRTRFVRCLHDPCDAKVVWTLGDGFEATARTRCDQEATVRPRVPDVAAEPTGTCRASATAPETELYATYKGDQLQLSPPAKTLTVELFTETRSPVSSCDVRIDGEPATPGPGSTYTAAVFGRVQIDGVCDGVPATPTAAYVVGDGKVSFRWQPSTPKLDVGAVAPWARAIALGGEDPRGLTWEIELPVGDDGIAVIPPLPVGTYRLGIGMDATRLRGVRTSDDVAPGPFQLVVVPDPEPREHPLMAGAMIVEERIDSGVIPIVRVDTE
jgi:hypothetical protein